MQQNKLLANAVKFIAVYSAQLLKYLLAIALGAVVVAVMKNSYGLLAATVVVSLCWLGSTYLVQGRRLPVLEGLGFTLLDLAISVSIAYYASKLLVLHMEDPRGWAIFAFGNLLSPSIYLGLKWLTADKGQTNG